MNMKISSRGFIASISIFALTLLSACASNPISTHYDVAKDADLSSYETFAWVENGPYIQTSDTYLSPLNAERISTAIERTVVDMGYGKVGVGAVPDFAISFTVGTRDRITAQSFPSYYRRNDWNWPYYYHEDVYVHKYTQGTLAIDVFDYKTGKPVWHGVAEKQVRESDYIDPEPVIELAVEAIMQNFPSKQ